MQRLPLLYVRIVIFPQQFVISLPLTSQKKSKREESDYSEEEEKPKVSTDLTYEVTYAVTVTYAITYTVTYAVIYTVTYAVIYTLT